MAKTAVSALQAVWDCRWARLAYPINRDTDHWVCVRDGHRHPTNAHDCETCTHWELKPKERTEPVVQADAAIRLAPRGPVRR